MAVFTAVATFVVGAATGIGFAAAGAAAITTGIGLSVAALSAGLALATSRLVVSRMTRNFRQDAQAANDPGVKLQLGPATDNKIPVMYGSVFTGGIITHANISNENKTMTYVMVISEQTDTGTYTVNDIYRNDVKLTFGSNASVISGEDSDGNPITNLENRIRCRVYVGDANNTASQIFPTTNKITARSAAPVLAQDNANMTGLVYAVFSMDYTPEAELVQLGAITFDITNSLSEPSAVLLDYLQNTRYGAGLTAAELDLPSFTDMETYSTAQVDYTPFDSSTTTHNRWQIDGMLSTYSTVKQNIDKICQSAATWFVYSPKVGKFAVKPNRPATTGELANAFVFADDNIISSFDISSTELYSLYNAVESEHPQYTQRDQTDVVYIELPELSLNPNEPLNKLTQRYDLVNDNSRVANLSNIDLRQSRFGTVLSFTADYSALVVDVGDVVKVSNAVYNYDSELFRVIRVDEQEGSDGSLTAQIVLLEYNIAVYDHDIVLQKSPVRNTGIPSRVINAEIIELDNADIANSALDGFPNASITPQMIDMFGLINADPIASEFSSLNSELANLSIILSDNSNTIANLNVELIQLDSDLANNTANITNLTANIIPQLNSDLANNTANITNLTANVIPQLNSDLSNNTNSITTLNTVTLPALESDLSNNSNSINTLTTITIPGLESDLSNNTNSINILNTVTLPALESNLSNNTNSINTLNTITLPGLESDLANLEAELANIEGANIDAYFPVTESNIANDSISSPKIITNAVISRTINAGAITAEKLSANSVTANAILAGTITALQIAANTITANQIAANTITANEIAVSTITGDRLQGNTITANQIAANTITANEIAVSTITGDRLQGNTITANQIAALTITSAEIAVGTITGDRIQGNTITANQIAANTITANQIAVSTITGDRIQGNTITANQIAALTITAAEIGIGSLTGDRLQGNTITANQINALAITAAEIAANAIIAEKILANAVVAGKIATNAVTTNTIAANAIVSEKIAANSIIADKIAANAISVGKLISNSLLTFDGANFAFELGTSANIGGYNGAAFFRTQKTNAIGVGAIAASTGSFAVAGQQVSDTGFAATFVNSTVAGGLNHKTDIVLGAQNYAGAFTHFPTPGGSPGNRANLATNSYAIDATGAVRITGNLVVTGNVSAANITGAGGNGAGTVTSVAFSTGTTGLSVTGSPITTSGTITLAGTLAVANGGTGVTTSTGSGSVVLSTSPTLTTPALGTPSSATLTNATGLPIVNGTTGTLSVARGGTGQTTYNNGELLIGNGSGLSKSTLTAGSGISITNGSGSITIAATGGGGTVTSVSGTGTVSGLTLTGTVTTSGSLTLGGTISLPLTQTTGTLSVDRGGTGATTLSSGGYLKGAGTSAITSQSGIPAGDITSGTLAVARGGTGVTTSTGSGSVVLSTSPSLTTPSIGAATGTSLSVTGDVTAFASDARLKTFNGVIPDALAKVLKLNGYHFQFNQVAADLGYDPDQHHVGVSAQEVQAVLPEVVKPAPISDQYLTVQYEKIVPLLIEAIKDLAQQVAELRGKQ